MEYNEKYLKYKNKYFILKNMLGGGINKPIYYHYDNSLNPNDLEAKYNIDQKDIRSRTTDINTPYIDHEILGNGIPKIRLFNKNASYSTMPPKNSNTAYIGEGGPKGRDPKYCVRSVYYPPSNIRFASYNVHNFVKQCETNNVTPLIGKDINHAIDTIKKLNADILFLQEITPEHEPWPADSKESEAGNFNNFVQRLGLLGYNNYFIGDTHYSTKDDALDINRPYFMLCNATFSKHPILENYSVGLGNNRICIHVMIDCKDYFVSTYNAHLEFNDNIKDSMRNNIPYKITQINKLAKYIYDSSKILEVKYTTKPIFYILGGDFNNDYNTPKIFDPIKSIMKILNPLLSLENDDGKPKITGQNFQQLLDFFFISGPPDYNYNNNYLIIPNNHSDHYPILYDFVPLKLLK
jgi:endonuclease/exonuclease/phosphatase family metal-dependent hydrolase